MEWQVYYAIKFLVIKYHSVEKARPNSNQGETDREGERNLENGDITKIFEAVVIWGNFITFWVKKKKTSD